MRVLLAIAGLLLLAALGGLVFLGRADSQGQPSAPTLVLPLRSVGVSNTTTNRGSARAITSTTRYYLSPTQAWSTLAIRLTGERLVPSLNPGSRSSGTTQVTVPGASALGTY